MAIAKHWPLCTRAAHVRFSSTSTVRPWQLVRDMRRSLYVEREAAFPDKAVAPHVLQDFVRRAKDIDFKDPEAFMPQQAYFYIFFTCLKLFFHYFSMFFFLSFFVIKARTDAFDATRQKWLCSTGSPSAPKAPQEVNLRSWRICWCSLHATSGKKLCNSLKLWNLYWYLLIHEARQTSNFKVSCTVESHMRGVNLRFACSECTTHLLLPLL